MNELQLRGQWPTRHAAASEIIRNFVLPGEMCAMFAQRAIGISSSQLILSAAQLVLQPCTGTSGHQICQSHLSEMCAMKFETKGCSLEQPPDPSLNDVADPPAAQCLPYRFTGFQCCIACSILLIVSIRFQCYIACSTLQEVKSYTLGGFQLLLAMAQLVLSASGGSHQ